MQTANQYGLYAQQQARIADRLVFTLNGRQDWVKTDSDAKIGTTYKSNEAALSGRAGLAYEFANGVTPYVSAATFF
ncbi:TonB-dependent receptor, partial [Acinetobacter baumannii]